MADVSIIKGICLYGARKYAHVNLRIDSDKNGRDGNCRCCRCLRRH